VVALTFDYAGSAVDVSGSWLAGFCAFCLMLVTLTVYFNRSTNHDAYFVDEHWGDGSIDDEDWAIAVDGARRTVREQLRELAERSAAR
jgi:hypothetical protein